MQLDRCGSLAGYINQGSRDFISEPFTDRDIYDTRGYAFTFGDLPQVKQTIKGMIRNLIPRPQTVRKYLPVAIGIAAVAVGGRGGYKVASRLVKNKMADKAIISAFSRRSSIPSGGQVASLIRKYPQREGEITSRLIKRLRPEGFTGAYTKPAAINRSRAMALNRSLARTAERGGVETRVNMERIRSKGTSVVSAGAPWRGMGSDSEVNRLYSALNNYSRTIRAL